jgi:hemerythrin-like metal-binding protein
MAIKWDYTTMTTGSSEIDEEHQEWIRRFNEFDAAIANGQGLEAIQHILHFLAEYTVTHFAHEEARMAQHNSPVAALNRTEHGRFRANLDEIERWMQQEGTSLVEVVSVKIDMENWLINHICKIDAQLRPC